MASVNYLKCKDRQSVIAVLRHGDKEERLKHEHSNKQIDKTKTHLNMQMNRSYAETIEYMDARIHELEYSTNTNHRKDRVLVMALEAPLPKGLTVKQEKQWVKEFYQIVADMYGEENILNCYYHADEENEYLDENNNWVVSRHHVHIPVIAEHNGSFNGKWFSSKSNMVKLNNAVHKMSQNEFGVDFMDGTKRKSKKTVEQLKNDSAVREAVQKGIEELLPSIQAKARAEAENALRTQFEALQRQSDELQKERNELEQEKLKIHDFKRVANLRVVKGNPIKLKDGRVVYEAGQTVAEKEVELLRRDSRQTSSSNDFAHTPSNDRYFGE